jgi:hypothetical protein
MKSSDRAVLMGLVIVGLGAMFWFMLLAPKREEVSNLEADVEKVRTELQQAEATVSTARAAEADYKSNYRTVVTLGKAVPSDADSPSLMTQLQTIADRAEVDFRELELVPGASSEPTPTQQTTTDQAAAPTDTATPTATAAPPTESAAATLPLGASVGPAGLPTMPYKLVFSGEFFEMADFLEGLDGLVGKDDEALEVGGRLMTVNGFTVSPPPGDPEGPLVMELTMTTYVTPADQGVTAGASPAAPAPATGAEPTTVAAPTGTVAP